MKKISLLIPTYNEEGNIKEIYERITALFKTKLNKYDYEVVFIDNASCDRSRDIIRELAGNDRKVKAIFNVRNFGWVRSSFYGLTQTTGDATVFIQADMQEPPELIFQFVSEWEAGTKIVIGIKNKSKESRLMYMLRSVYYSLIKKMADIEQIEHFTGFGLYDKSFIEVLRNLDDPMPYLRGIISELGYKHKKIYYEQEQRKAGKSKFNFLRLYDLAMLGFTSYSKIAMRSATLLGAFIALVCFLLGLVTVVRKLLFWNTFAPGMAAVVTGIFFIGSIQLIFIGILGEYVLNINTKVTHRPLVIEEERIGFEGS